MFLVIKPVDWSQSGNVEPDFMVRSHDANEGKPCGVDGVAFPDGLNIAMHSLDGKAIAF